MHLVLKNRRNRNLSIAGYRHGRSIRGMDGKALSTVHKDRLDVRDMRYTQCCELLLSHVTNVEGYLTDIHATDLVRLIV
jgi:hypothetical protein